jgi:inner membrane protein
MPFSGRWFYGDTLFIVDAWMWLLMGASAVFAYSQTRWSRWGWIALGLAASALVTGAGLVPMASKMIWWLGIALIVGFRIRGVPMSRNPIVALGCMSVFSLYVLALAAGNRHVMGKVQDWLGAAHGETLAEVMVGPLPANPFYREVLAVTNTRYYGLRVPVFGHDAIETRYEPVPLPQPDLLVERALQNKDIRGFVNWMRFPVYEVQEVEQGYRVLIRDLRYVRPDQESDAGIGMAETFVPRAD